jgi:hypothetical protein
MPSGVYPLLLNQTIFMILGKNNMPIEAPQHFMLYFLWPIKTESTQKLVGWNTTNIAYFHILTTWKKITNFCYSNIHAECTYLKKKTWQSCENIPWPLV